MQRPVSVYVHVPFCVVKCGYCDFTSYTVEDRTVMDRYLDGLHQELKLAGLPDRPHTVFFGGGTPTYLDEERLRRLFAITGRILDLRGTAEVTMEANPESVTAEKAKLMKEAGVTRVSMGVQSFDPDFLRFLDRAHDAEQARRAYDIFRTAGFDNISLDLIFALPGQTLTQWQQDLETALSWEPDHLSCYNLTFEPGTRLTKELERGEVKANPDRLDRQMFEWTRTRCAEAGYAAYETSNFAGRGGPCRHNLHYWQQGDYVGVGPGAAEHRGGVRGTNLKPLDAWCSSLEKGIRPVASAETLDPRQGLAEALWLGLRMSEGIDLDELNARLGRDPREVFAAELARLQEEGMVELEGSRLRLSAEGTLFGNTVGEAFL